MTFDEVCQSKKPFLTAADISNLVGADPNSIRGQAHEMPDKLGFPVCVIGSRVKIPRLPFIKFLAGEGAIV